MYGFRRNFILGFNTQVMEKEVFVSESTILYWLQFLCIRLGFFYVLYTYESLHKTRGVFDAVTIFVIWQHCKEGFRQMNRRRRQNLPSRLFTSPAHAYRSRRRGKRGQPDTCRPRGHPTSPPFSHQHLLHRRLTFIIPFT